jgi:glycosyltransferase involved in cell wall biosynthesis
MTKQATDERPLVTIVVPCFNEQDAVPQLMRALKRLTDQLDDRYALWFVFVDDGSSDDTVKSLREHMNGKSNHTLVRHRQNRGVAAAIMSGVRAARGEIVCSIDCDCTYDPQQLQDMIPLLTDGVDLVTASPYHPQGQVCNVPRWRLIFSKAASLTYRLAFRQKLFTYTSCFRVYRRSTVVDIELKNEGFVGIAEVLWRLERRGATVVEHPAVLEARTVGRSKMRIPAAAGGHLRLLFRVMMGRWRPAATAGSGPPANVSPQDPRLPEPAVCSYDTQESNP